MAIWSGKAKKYRVRIKGMKLELGVNFDDRERLLAIEIKWEGPSKPGLPSLYRKSIQCSSSEIRVLKLRETQIQFDDDDADEFVNVCAFSYVSNDPDSFAPWLVSFHILSGEIEEPSSSTSSSRSKMQVIEKVGINLGELASKMDPQIEHQIPVSLQMDGVSMEATLKMLVSFTETKNGLHSRTASDDSLGAGLGDSTIFHRRTKSQEQSVGSHQLEEKPKKSKLRIFRKRSTCMIPDESNSSNSEAELGTSTSFDSHLDTVNKRGFWKWWRPRRRSSKHPQAESPDSSTWETKEILSRDGKTRVKTNVFFSSYDQRGEEASGANACAAIVAVIAHWLQINQDAMPTGPELDRLIKDGSLEWRKLCEDELLKECFPDQHFDLETILRARLRPLAVHPSNSRFGFFHPEEFEHLKDAVSFDDIWTELNENIDQDNPRVYIVRWNDHFFALKMSLDANYIVDSLGERLHEGCTRAYILKFDESSVMYTRPEEGEGGEKVVCKGKECCREYMKRFLAAIQLRELKEEEEKGRKVDVFALYKKLQIDFHLSSSNSSAVSTANSSVLNSPNTSSGFLGD